MKNKYTNASTKEKLCEIQTAHQVDPTCVQCGPINNRIRYFPRVANCVTHLMNGGSCTKTCFFKFSLPSSHSTETVKTGSDPEPEPAACLPASVFAARQSNGGLADVITPFRFGVCSPSPLLCDLTENVLEKNNGGVKNAHRSDLADRLNRH